MSGVYAHISMSLDGFVAGAGDSVANPLGDGAGLLDELMVHVAPVFLGGGPRLFDAPGLASVELEPVGVLRSPRASHIRYRRVR